MASAYTIKQARAYPKTLNTLAEVEALNFKRFNYRTRLWLSENEPTITGNVIKSPFLFILIRSININTRV